MNPKPDAPKPEKPAQAPRDYGKNLGKFLHKPGKKK